MRLLNQVYERRNPRTKATVNQLLDNHLSEADLEFSTLDGYNGYADKQIRPLLGGLKVGALDVGVMDYRYAELRRCRDHCKNTKGEVDPEPPASTHAMSDADHTPASRSQLQRSVRFTASSTALCDARCARSGSQPIDRRRRAARGSEGQPRAHLRRSRLPASSTRPSKTQTGNPHLADHDHGPTPRRTLRNPLASRRLDNAVLHLEKAIGQRSGRKWAKDTKAHQDRRITLDPDTTELLREHKARSTARAEQLQIELADDSFAFSLAPDRSTHLIPDSVTQRYSKLASRLRIKTTLHKLCHCSATELIAAGVDIRTVAGRLGHGGGGTTPCAPTPSGSPNPTSAPLARSPPAFPVGQGSQTRQPSPSPILAPRVPTRSSP
ncbi:site-specific integrase [Kribbella turkmenica]|uniref:tyrosine-type recombinase/integrase n=1 Tax=Kribbella turkmenica TaxID=2530375 RepID=UPI00192D4911|nr:tyrosine-type recombinase/integrase [Kribbella turkmenica]